MPHQGADQLRPQEDGELGPRVEGLLRGHTRQEEDEQESRDPGDAGQDHEGRAPAELLTDRRARGGAEHVGDGRAEEDRGDGARRLARLDELGRDDGTEAEEGGLRERRHDARGDHQLVGRRERAG